MIFRPVETITRTYHMRIDRVCIGEPAGLKSGAPPVYEGLCAVMVHELEAMMMRPSSM